MSVDPTGFTEEDQVGLVLPNGRTIWPPNDYKGRPLNTQEDRAVMLSVLQASARELDFDESAFLAQYRWATRRVEPLGIFPVDHRGFTTVVEEIADATE